MIKKFLVLCLFWASRVCLGSNFYAGSDIGVESADFKETTHALGPYTQAASTKNLAGHGALIDFFGGYCFIRQHFYLGSELGFTSSSLAYNTYYSDPLYGINTETRYSLYQHGGVSFLPGYLFKDGLLLYGRVGYERGLFQLHTTDDSLTPLHAWIGGIRYGLGVEKSFTPQWGARLDVSRIQYQGVNYQVNQGNGATNIRITPTTMQVALGALYRF